MRLAVLIIALCFSIACGLQSMVIAAGSGIAGNADMILGGQSGMATAVLFVIGAAFVMGMPLVAAAVFGLAALVAFAGSSTAPEFKDLQIWAWLALFLVGGSIIGSYGLRKKKRQKAEEKRLEAEQRQLMKDFLAAQAGKTATQ